MPTNIEQSDLNIATFGGHGDSPRVVIAPSSVEDCFYSAIEAVNIARKYSTPVLFLTDQGIASQLQVMILVSQDAADKAYKLLEALPGFAPETEEDEGEEDR